MTPTTNLFTFAPSERTPDTYPRYFTTLIDRTTALCDLQTAGIPYADTTVGPVTP